MADESRDSSAVRTGIRLSYKIIGYILVWLVALFATDPSLKTWALVWMFPLGLVAFFNLQLGNDGGWWVIGGVTFIYLVHAIFYFRSNTTRAAILWFSVLIVLLVCNVSGCRAQLPR
jgi:hypothetical protein